MEIVRRAQGRTMQALCAGHIEISFIDYLKVGLPVTLVTLAIDVAWLQFLR